jgi:hypothetical protein
MIINDNFRYLSMDLCHKIHITHTLLFYNLIQKGSGGRCESLKNLISYKTKISSLVPTVSYKKMANLCRGHWQVQCLLATTAAATGLYNCGRFLHSHCGEW